MAMSYFAAIKNQSNEKVRVKVKEIVITKGFYKLALANKQLGKKIKEPLYQSNNIRKKLQ